MKNSPSIGKCTGALPALMYILLMLLAHSPISAVESDSKSAESPNIPTVTSVPDAQTPTTKALPKFITPGTPHAEKTSQWSMVINFLRIGFTHILPEGLDHILFVLGLFLLSPKLKPLLIQVTAFTIAHSITLGLCMANLVKLPSAVVEPLIAISIVFVAVENMMYKELKPWRWMVVFGFGLIHGLGFADALKELQLPEGTFFTALISFNVGVEAGQMTVIAAATLMTVWFWKKPWYRSRITVPASTVIAAVGLYWAIERVFF